MVALDVEAQSIGRGEHLYEVASLVYGLSLGGDALRQRLYEWPEVLVGRVYDDFHCCAVFVIFGRGACASPWPLLA